MAQAWFKHDYNASDDDKMVKLRLEHGWEGHGLFWGIIERMARIEDGTINPDDADLIAATIGQTDEKTVSEVIQTCIEVGLFVKDEKGRYRNKRITEHIKEMEQAAENGRKGAQKRWSKQSNGETNRGANGNPNADKIREDNTKLDNTTKAQYNGSHTPTIEPGEDFGDSPKLESGDNDV